VTGNKEIEQLIGKAAKFHGHLGPFLVLGVRMGDIAKRHLRSDEENDHGLSASIRTPFLTPFSCVIDGIQVSTSCTIGNRKLVVQNSTKIRARFKLQNSRKAMIISVKPEVVENLVEQMSKGAEAERLARKIAHVPEEQLFVLKEK
jgi:formylmethanofuran dehydrogenase subunit E